jgi:histidinol-phosphate/aromatic aminotransferase/cobyric acid decarboxylase-like protein
MDGWGLPRHLRMSLGTAPEIQRALEAMKAVLCEG